MIYQGLKKMHIKNIFVIVQKFIIQKILSRHVGSKRSLNFSKKKNTLKIRNPKTKDDFEITNDTLVTVPITIYAVNLPIFFGLLEQCGIEIQISNELADIIDLVSEDRPIYPN